VTSRGTGTGLAGPIDVQTHFLPSAVIRALEGRSEIPRIVRRNGARYVEYGRVRGAAYPLLPEMIDIDLKLEQMNRQGVGMSVLSVNIPGLDWFDAADAAVIARDTNDELRALVEANPKRLASFAALPMQVPEKAAVELDRAMDIGMQGTMLYSNVAGRSLDDPDFAVVFDTAAALSAPVLIHPTYPLSAGLFDAYAFVPVIGFLVDSSTAVLRLIFAGLFDRNPQLRLILGHLGGFIPYLLGRIDYESSRIPGGLGMLEVQPSEHVRKLYVDTVSAWPPALRLAIDFFGIQRILFATDHPFWEPQRTHAALADLGLNDKDLAAIQTDNAARLLGLDGIRRAG
jgi:predicted TIM-barrel fold metal-dependent hydrolase